MMRFWSCTTDAIAAASWLPLPRRHEPTNTPFWYRHVSYSLFHFLLYFIIHPLSPLQVCPTRLQALFPPL